MTTLSDTDVAYAAGFFDADGSVGIRYRSTKVVIGGVDRESIQWFRYKFQMGALYEQSRESPNRDFWSWQLTTPYAVHFLKIVLPYLKLKQGRAILALAYFKKKDTEPHLAEQFKSALGALNKRGSEAVDPTPYDEITEEALRIARKLR